MNNLTHSKEYIIRTYEVDKNGDLRIITLFNIFQDMADEHAEKLGVGLTFCLKTGFAWVGSRYHIKINRLPKIHEKIKIKTWPSEQQKFGAVRDFAVVDKDENEIISASSLWVLINIERRRPVPLSENLPYFSIHKVRSLQTEFPKIPEIINAEKSVDFRVRYDDIDINNHVNNAVYPLWASEGVDIGFHADHSIAELEIEFKKEGLLGETISVETTMNAETSLHSVKCKEDGRELSRARIIWKQF
ncbi:MAG: hypothetical protein LBR70_01915 [Lactobacillaceae bacterium]|jgi:acyl-ACP thioesterase|nr:hypothetical protein [Lactobacillaceae bacterium]